MCFNMHTCVPEITQLAGPDRVHSSPPSSQQMWPSPLVKSVLS